MSVYRAELERLQVSAWSARDLRIMLLDESSSYTFDVTDVYVADVTSSGGVEGSWTGYTRETLAPSSPSWSSGWVCTSATADFGIIGTAITDKTAGVVVYEHVTNDADSLLVAHFDVSPAAVVWDGVNPFLVTFGADGIVKVS